MSVYVYRRNLLLPAMNSLVHRGSAKTTIVARAIAQDRISASVRSFARNRCIQIGAVTGIRRLCVTLLSCLLKFQPITRGLRGRQQGLENGRRSHAPGVRRSLNYRRQAP